MIVIAILGTIAAALWTFVVVLVNGSPGPFKGEDTIWAAWIGVILLWLFWSFG